MRQTDFEHAEISEKLKALPAIDGKAQLGGKNVAVEDVARARDPGATDLEIHDTVLIAAFFYRQSAGAPPQAPRIGRSAMPGASAQSASAQP